MAWAPAYTTAAILATYMRVGDTADSVQAGFAIAAASRAIDQTCGRQFGKTGSVEARYYTPVWDRQRGRWVVPIDDVMTTTGMLVRLDLQDDATFTDAITDYNLKPVNAAALGRPWTEIVVHPDSTNTPDGTPDSVEVTATWGWTAVPDTITQACLLQSSRFLSRRDSPYGVAGSSEMGSEMRLMDKVDPDVAVALRPYQRQWWAA
jgi:hypothetical protein